ncbi:DNA (cytosine-5)-methyltransferase 1 [Pseudomonas sp. JUb42]|uniref:DNA cytosine methyltransferase n=1 Tax=Pseudomonas sp. JUb42 TaxID=2940611 RepID=UPI002167EC70|nr:DNA cytosine methyltransferase [Pseudomonas sp. JUb42]MCS3467141.1 DNA (cytosine-5)-methyltransferase 1 [Pseudomonas sp. JUb42]
MTAFQKLPSMTLGLPFLHELVVDLFAGGGGASEGIARAYRHPDVAVNHNAIAIAVHRANHPDTDHYQADVFEVDPIKATRGQPVGILWASPDCRHHSKAKGGKPRDRKVRGLAWVVVRWAYATRPRLIFLENVEEFADWGPLDDNGKPIKAERGRTFRAFVAALGKGLPADHPDMPEILAEIGEHVPVEALVRGLGYDLEHRVRVASNAGAPTIRKRLYVVARRDGEKIVWPAPTRHKLPAKNQAAWREAHECIDWSLLGRTIFREDKLVHNTMARIAKGLWRHTLAAEKPFIVPMRGTSKSHTSTHGVDEPLSTISGGGTHHALVDAALTPFLTEHANATHQRTFSAQEPLRTQVAQCKGGHFAVASAHLTHLTHHGDRSGYSLTDPVLTVTGANRGEQALVSASMITLRKGSIGAPATEPLGCITSSTGHHAISSAFFEQANGGFYEGDGRPATAPVSTVCQSGSNQRLVTAYLVKYYGAEKDGISLRGPMHTLPAKDRMGLVSVVQLPNHSLTDEQLDGAKRCAAFLREYLPQHFTEYADVVMVGDYVMVDITLRMLQPLELKRAQGFDDSYIIDRGLFLNAETGDYEWRPITKTNQVRLVGNSVCPDEAEALVRANAAPLIELYQRLAA